MELPGQDLVTTGVADLRAGRETEAALLVAMAAPRLRRLGFEIPPHAIDQPGHSLYRLVGTHSGYNALIGRMTSFARAAERAGAR